MFPSCAGQSPSHIRIPTNLVATERASGKWRTRSERPLAAVTSLFLIGSVAAMSCVAAAATDPNSQGQASWRSKTRLFGLTPMPN